MNMVTFTGMGDHETPPEDDPLYAPLRGETAVLTRHVHAHRHGRDVFVEIYARRRVEECLLVPAVAEPQIVWILSGSALVEEREFGGNMVGAKRHHRGVFSDHDDDAL